MITISKNSRLYKFYIYLSTLPLFYQLTPFSEATRKTNYEKVNMTFNDICTFLRTTLLYMFVALPISLTSISCIFIIIYNTVVSTIQGDVNLFMAIIFSLIAVVLIGASIIGIIYFFISSNTSKTFKENIIEKFSDENTKSWFVLMCKAIKAKHDKVCKQIKVEE